MKSAHNIALQVLLQTFSTSLCASCDFENFQGLNATSTVVYVNHDGVGWKLVTIVWADIGVLSIWLSWLTISHCQLFYSI